MIRERSSFAMFMPNSMGHNRRFGELHLTEYPKKGKEKVGLGMKYDIQRTDA
jgi:hypothetical protein